jgi:hypothetical protein
VQATFPELPAALAQQSAQVIADGWPVAVRKAGSVFKAKTARRRITVVELRVVRLPDEKEDGQ